MGSFLQFSKDVSKSGLKFSVLGARSLEQERVALWNFFHMTCRSMGVITEYNFFGEGHRYL